MNCNPGDRVAILGGDGRFHDPGLAHCKLSIFLAKRYGGNGELRRLEAALACRSFDRVIILARWNGHSATRRALRLCRRHRIPFEVVP